MGQPGAAVWAQCKLNPDPSLSLRMTDDGFSSPGHLGVILSKAKNLFLSSVLANARYEVVTALRGLAGITGLIYVRLTKQKISYSKPGTRNLDYKGGANHERRI